MIGQGGEKRVDLTDLTAILILGGDAVLDHPHRDTGNILGWQAFTAHTLGRFRVGDP
jgi:hypothetical protein